MTQDEINARIIDLISDDGALHMVQLQAMEKIILECKDAVLGFANQEQFSPEEWWASFHELMIAYQMLASVAASATAHLEPLAIEQGVDREHSKMRLLSRMQTAEDGLYYAPGDTELN